MCIRDSLFHYANIVLSNASLAEEAVQETFVIACTKQHALENSPNPEGWIMNTLKNVCRNIQKNRNYYLTRILSLNESVLGTTTLESDKDVYKRQDVCCISEWVLHTTLRLAIVLLASNTHPDCQSNSKQPSSDHSDNTMYTFRFHEVNPCLLYTSRCV